LKKLSKQEQQGHIIIIMTKDVAKIIAMSVGAPVVLIYLLAAETVMAAKRIVKRGRVHPIDVL
jgi:hypothetical protein